MEQESIYNLIPKEYVPPKKGNDVWLTIGIGAGLAFLLMLGKGLFVALLAPLAVLASAWFTSHWIARRLGGYTGDTLGAVQQKAEVVFLVVAALFIGS